ncbi:MAG: redox-regulated ATPase YchF [Oligoflexia bacterium]|nr:redox-regulated ATPase YchF [Oligoflexia bacterium]
MALNIGIVGLPNVGKSTIFSALTSTFAEAANYPFCTIDPNIGIVNVPDPRLKKITELISPKSIVPTTVEFVDIAGLVKGASSGEGLGNKFLSHIRQVNAIAHIVRCFDDPNITHVHGIIDPISDINTIQYELALADLDTVEKRISNLDRLLKSQVKETQENAKKSLLVLKKISEELQKGLSVRSLKLTTEEESIIQDLQLITQKKQFYVCNVDEHSFTREEKNCYVQVVENYAAKEGAQVITISGQIEKEISMIENEQERDEFMSELGIKETGLTKLILSGYQLLNMETFFTAGEKEVRAWTFPSGATAPKAAGIIHSDFERGFIRVEVYRYEDLVELKSEQKVKEKGKLRIEGKDYIVKDGDILFFRFNV